MYLYACYHSSSNPHNVPGTELGCPDPRFRAVITRRVGMLHHPAARLLALLAPCIVAIQPSDTYA